MTMSFDPEQVQSAERTLSIGTWAITAGAVLYSVLTVTPLVQEVTPDAWDWTGPILPIVVDSAVVIVIRLDSVVSRLGMRAGAWPALLRWMTGLMTLLLNIGNSALSGDLVGVAVHAVAPLLLIVTAEAGLAYRRALAEGLARIKREQDAEHERSRAEQRAEARVAREEREAREAREREDRERDEDRRERREREDREHAWRMQQNQAEREDRQAREQREHEARMERERTQQAAAENAAEQARQTRAQADLTDRALRDQQAVLRREHPVQTTVHAPAPAPAAPAVDADRVPAVPVPAASVNTPAPTVNTAPAAVNTPRLNEGERVPEEVARAIIADPANADHSVRTLATMTGWSVGWVAARRAEARKDASPVAA
ncbi:DUF2637 domain-containing protein [Streptomyces brasiliensis]|uniref:DUF2637 domain-containing protein n=1 Tax=Streptomyces brasiliensis TaxID=1954 RepID=A0A917KHQ6_9ACTN|nr:DUF2637 domain-containing protein [Streptomyces brasiliensis]GGJ14458.1 hypothetical protein GCM10010121_026340 [Streptomyces brasiliensis]